MTPADDLFARARERSLAEVAGVDLFRAGRRLRGQCPVCQSGAKKRAGGPFWIDPDIGRWGCFAGDGMACGDGGDVIDLERILGGGSAREAAERLAGRLPGRAPRPTRAPKPQAAGGRSDFAAQLARRLWAESRPAAGTPVETYLRGRGLAALTARSAADLIRFHPAAYWGGRGADEILRPAMLVRPETAEGPTGGLHVTYLRADGSAKAGLDPAKRMWGPQTGPGDRPGGAWLLKGRPGPLIVAEGVENALSAAELWARSNGGVLPNAAAALSLRALQGGWLADRWGRRDPDLPRPDPERPAFAWPWTGEVLIAVDRDMKAVRRDGRPLTVRARRANGGTWDRPLSSDDRARICGTLAQAAWRGAGANAVRTIAPPAGLDFNDHLRSVYGHG